MHECVGLGAYGEKLVALNSSMRLRLLTKKETSIFVKRVLNVLNTCHFPVTSYKIIFRCV